MEKQWQHKDALTAARAQDEWQAKLEKYPSLKKVEEQGNDYVESHDGREEKLLAFMKRHSNYSNMKNNPPLVLEAIDEFSGQQEWLINIGSDKGRKICDIITKQKPKVYVEFGGYIGYSAIMFADQIRKQHPGESDIHIWSLEFDHHIADIATELINLAGLQDIATVVKGPAAESMRELHSRGSLSNIDFLFIDHVEELYEKDLQVALDELKLLKSGAVVVADNIILPGAPKYRKYVRSRKDLKSEGIKGLLMPGEVEDELEVSYVL